MAEKKIVYVLDVDTSGVNVSSAAKSLESLKKKILETELQAATLRKEMRNGSKSIEEVAGPISQHEARLKSLREAYLKSTQQAAGLQSFTEKIGSQFAQAIGPLEGFMSGLSKLGPIGGTLGALVGTVNDISSTLTNMFAAGKKGSEGVEQVAKSSANAEKAAESAKDEVKDLGDTIAKTEPQAKKGAESLDHVAKAEDNVADQSDDAVAGIKDVSKALDKMDDVANDSGAHLDSLAKFTNNTTGAAKGAAGGIGGMMSALGPAGLVVGLAVGAIAALGKALFETAAHIEQVEKKAEQLYGDAFPKIQAAALANANDLGITSTRYLELASAQQVVFSSLGLTATQMVDLTPKLLEAADNLADFTGNGLDTASAMGILTSAVRGNLKGLQELGIAVRRKPEELKAMSDAIYEAGGVTHDQAEALGSLQLVLDGVGKEAAKFGSGQKTIADNADRAAASVEEQKDRLAKGLIPAFQLWSRVVGDTSEALANLLGVPPVNSEADKAAEEQAKYNAELDKQVTSDAVVGASMEKLIETRERLNKAVESFKAKGFTEDVAITEESIRLLESEISLRNEATAAAEAAAKKKKEEEDAVAKLGLSYEALTLKLAGLNEIRKDIQDSDKTAIAASNKEIAEVEKRLKAFDRQKVGMSALATAQKTFAESQAQLALAYEITNIKINDALSDGLISQEDAQRMLLDAEVANIAARLQAKETLATADKRLTADEKKNILELNEALNKSKKAVEDYGKSIADNVRDREATIRINLETADANLDKVVADIIATDELTASFDLAFNTIANDFGADIREELKAAAQQGTIDFEGLRLNIDTSVGKDGIDEQLKLIESLRTAYEKFRLETDRNKLQLIAKEDQIALDAAKASLDDLKKKLEDLRQDNREKIELGIDVPQADLDKVDELQKDIKDLEGKVVEVKVKVAADTSALDVAKTKIDAVGEPVTEEKETQSDSLLKSLGLDEESASFAINAAKDLVQQISDVILEGQTNRIERTLELDLAASQQQFDANIAGLQANLQAGQITQDEFNRRKLEAEKTAEAQRVVAQKKAFEQKQKVARAEAAVQFALELVGLATSAAPLGVAGPLFYGLQAAIATARYAAARIAIDQQKFAEGGVVELAQGGAVNRIKSVRGTALVNLRRRIDPNAEDVSTGTVLKGASHAEGGIDAVVGGQRTVSLEGDEIVINKRSSKLFREELSRINSYQGWGRAFAQGGIVNATNAPSYSAPVYHAPTFTLPKVFQSFARGGIVPAIYADGGQVSLMPSAGLVANRQQLEQAIQQQTETAPIVQQVERNPIEIEFSISQFEQQQSRMRKQESRVSYGG